MLQQFSFLIFWCWSISTLLIQSMPDWRIFQAERVYVEWWKGKYIKKRNSWKEPEDPTNEAHLQASEDALMFDIGWFAQVVKITFVIIYPGNNFFKCHL